MINGQVCNDRCRRRTDRSWPWTCSRWRRSWPSPTSCISAGRPTGSSCPGRGSSRLIASLEREIGGTLFDRTSRRVRLTPLGTRFRDQLRPGYAQLQAALAAARSEASRASGTLRVGITVTTGGEAVTRLVAAFQDAQPGCEAACAGHDHGRGRGRPGYRPVVSLARRARPGCDRRYMRPDIRPGGIFPDYALPDHTGTVRKLSELQGRDPLVLTLARGNYCPKEHRQHLELAAHYPEIAVAYTQVATIATDDHHTLQEFRASVGAQWPFLSDPGRTVQQDLDIAEYTDPEHNPMIPHTLVLKPGLVIHSIYNGYWFWGRPSFYDLWHDLRAASSEIRPDWDLSTPGLRAAWDAGDFSRFHGWDRRSPGSVPTSYT